MSRGTAERVGDIFRAVERAQRYVSSLENDDTTLADMAEDAVERNLQIIGEAVNRLPSDVIDTHPEVSWAAIRGFRNILVHEYFGVDAAVIRDVVDNHLAPLLDALGSYVEQTASGPSGSTKSGSRGPTIK